MSWVVFIVGFFGPHIWLIRAVRTRKLRVWKSLADAFDLVTVSVEAGLGLDAALRQVASKLKGPLAEELAQCLREVGMGRPRREALEDMAERVDVKELETFRERRGASGTTGDESWARTALAGGDAADSAASKGGGGVAPGAGQTGVPAGIVHHADVLYSDSGAGLHPLRQLLEQLKDSCGVANGSNSPTLYQILHVHPRAPLDLITGAYWRLTGKVQTMRGASHAAEMALYHLTRAYETLADHSARKAYDQSAGLSEEPVLPKLPPPPKRRRFFALAENEPPAEEVSVDYYEVLRLDPEADTVIVPEAFAVMRNYYLRIAAQQEARWELLDILEEARSVIADPELRRLYDQERANRTQGVPAKGTGAEAEEADTAPKPKRATKPAAKGGRKVKTKPSTAEKQAPAPANGASAEGGRKATVKNGAQPAPGTAAGPATEAPATPEEVQQDAEVEEEWGAVRIARLVAEISTDMVAGASQRVKQALDDRTEIEPIRAEEAEAALLTRFPAAPYPLSPTSYGMNSEAILSIIDGPETGRKFEVARTSFTIGCAEYCDVTLPGLAPDQLRLQFSNGSFALYSLTEFPEVYVHGECVDWAVLANGDSIEVGPYTLLFEVAGEDSSSE